MSVSMETSSSLRDGERLTAAAGILANGLRRFLSTSSKGGRGAQTGLDVANDAVLSVHGVYGQREPRKEIPC
jgi:hypothetical protein